MSVRAGNETARRDPLMQGVLVMVMFGLIWALVGAWGLSQPKPWPIVVAVVAVVAAILVAAACRRLRRTGKRRPRHMSSNGMRGFFWVNVVQTVAILLAVFILAKFDLVPLIAPITCLVVGLHFLPLARIFGQPQYVWTGLLLFLVAMGGCAMYANDFSGGHIRAVVGFAATAVLWYTALDVARYG